MIDLNEVRATIADSRKRHEYRHGMALRTHAEQLCEEVERLRRESAPDLLAALERLSAWGRMDEPSTSSNLADIIHEANAAIAKAGGAK